jgi:predicted secreted Zn-dependent protease
MIGAVSQLQHELSAQQRRFMAQLLADHDVHADDVEIELVEVEQSVQGVELILPPGCRTIRDMHDRIEQRLIWVPDDATEPQ